MLNDLLARIQALESQVRSLPVSQGTSGTAPSSLSTESAVPRLQFLSSVVTVYSGGAITLTRFNAAPYIPASATAVLLQVSGNAANSTTGWRYVHIRATASGTDYYAWGSTSAGVDTDTEGNTVTALFPCSSQAFYYSEDAGINNCAIRLLGYIG